MKNVTVSVAIGGTNIAAMPRSDEDDPFDKEHLPILIEAMS